MVSRATKRFWKSVAIGLALSPALAVDTAVLAQSPAPTISAVKDEAGSAKPVNDLEAVRQLVRDGRKALKDGDKAKAEKLARQAMAMKVTMPFYETDTPEKLLMEIGVKATPPVATTTTGDPKVLVKQGYDALKAGNLDEAQRLGTQASASRTAKWGLFDDTPSKLLDEVQKARTAKNKTESIKVLADARKAYEGGKLEDAEKLAYKASTLHGPYSVWDLGDRPEKLLAEVQTAKDKQKKSKVPAVPNATAVAAKAKANDKTAEKKADATAVKPAEKKTEATAAKLADSKPQAVAAKPADIAAAVPTEPNAMPMPIVAQVTPPAPNWPTEVSTADVKVSAGEVTTAAATVAPNAANTVVQVKADNGPAKAKAVALVNEGRSLQNSGRFLEARAKYAEAQKCGVEFGPTEIGPDGCMIDLAAAVMKQVDAAIRDAQAPMTTPDAMRTCESKLKASREMAAGFGLDTQPLDAYLAMLASASGQPAVPPVPNVADTLVQGQNLLEKCRLELRRGQCEMARQLANEVYNGNFGLQNEAVALLRNIDVEEHNQRVLASNRNFDAAMTAYRNKDMGTCQAVLRQCDANLLSPDKRAQMKEVLLSSQKTEAAVAKAPAAPPAQMGVKPVEPAKPAEPANPVQQVAATGKPASGIQQATVPPSMPATPAMKPASEGDSLAAQVQAMQQIEYQRLRAEGLEVQSKAMSQFERGETDAAMETLETYGRKLKATKLDSASVDRLQRPIDARINSFKLLRAEKEFQNNVVKKKERFQQEMSKAAEAEMKKQGQIKDLMKQFNALYKDGKYKEAEIAAAKAHELDPDDPSTEAALKLAQIHGRTNEYDKIQNDKEAMVRKGLNDAESVGPAVDMQNPIAFDKVQMKIAQGRAKDKNGISMRSLSEKEKEIGARMMKSVNVAFTNVPLRQCIDDLRATTGMNIYTDVAALQAESISADQPITVKADGISMKSALKLILDQAHLTHVIQDEVLKITTEKAARGKLQQRVYSVADLVIPIDDYMLPTSANLQASMDRVTEQQRVNLNGSNTPFTNMRNGLPNGTAVGSGSNNPLGVNAMRTMPDGSSGVQQGNIGSPMTYSAAVAPTKQTMQDMLIKLITNTVAPDSWAAVGGSGTIDYMPIGLALVINQTPDVQEQVVDLLEALRRLQDLEVAVEVRIITLAETFFERIGLDFALNIKTDKGTSQYEPQLVTNQFKPAGQINDFSPTRFLSGLRPGGVMGQSEQFGSFTSDLDIPIRSSSFQYAIPPFGYPNNPGFNGGLSLGLAFLSDIQVYMFMEAAQGDRRTNVMQAPKLTLFNGQTSTLTVSDQQFFVTNVNVVGFGGQIVFVPQNNAFPLGVNLTIQAVVSADRRFVRLNITPTLSNLASAIVPLFPVTTFITPVFEGGAQGQPIPFTQFIQQPQFSTVTIQTTVAVPDGGTVIMGGLKTLSEGRNEFGPPVLSKLPYVNRLFKNVGYGREAQSLLLMVTPRIIINAEEEERQTGWQSTPPPQ